jgi:ATP-dependent 26S proteasome regulatory subunit
MRRITYKVNFPFPDAQTRCAIWKRLLPAERLGKDVDLMEVAKKFELSGGSIRTCALRACYKAARTSGVITSEILKEVCEHEYKALGRLFREG